MTNVLQIAERRKDGRIIKVIDGELVEFFGVEQMKHDHRGFYLEQEAAPDASEASGAKVLALKPRAT